MKKAIWLFLLFFVVLAGNVLWRKHTAMQLLSGGFGTQYKDSPYPFNRPSYPVDCLINNYKLKEVILTVQQGQTTLNIPADAYREARKRADAEKCTPIDIDLYYVFYNGKLLKHGKSVTGLGKSEAMQAGYSSTGPQRAQAIEVKLIDLLESPEETKAKLEKLSVEDNPQRYEPQLKMKHFPLWFYPNAINANSPKREFHNTFGVMSSTNPFTQKNYVVRCGIDIGQIYFEPKNKADIDKILNAKSFYKLYPNKNCIGNYYIKTDKTLLKVSVMVYPEAVPYIDQIYAQLDGIIKSYIAPSAEQSTLTPSN